MRSTRCARAHPTWADLDETVPHVRPCCITGSLHASVLNTVARWEAGFADGQPDYPQLADLLAERHKIIGNNWQNASTAQLIARYLDSSASAMA